MYGFTHRPPMPFTIAASAARTADGNTGNLKDTSTPWPMAASYTVIVDVTAFTNVGAVSNLVITLDQSFDNGTTWWTFARFDSFTTSTATSRLNIRNGLDIGASGTQVSTTSNSLNANTLISRDVRAAWDFSGGTPTATFQIKGVANPDSGAI